MRGRQLACALISTLGLALWARLAFSAAPVVDLQPLDRTREPLLRSVEARTASSILFVNGTSETRKVYWLDYEGHRRLVGTLAPGKSLQQSTYLTHAWVVTDSGDHALAVFLPASVPGRADLPMRAVEPAGVRRTEDLPDDSPDYQVHVMYVLPSDGVDQKLDIDGAIADSVTAAQDWLAGQTGGRRVRFDTVQGAPDITFYRLSRPDDQLRSYKEFVRDQIEYELAAAGFDRPNKVYAVYYGGGNTTACASGALPPELLGRVAGIYLNGGLPGAAPCSSNGLAAAGSPAGYLDLSLLHEIFHTLGMVQPCAPHFYKGHVSDDPRDLMYAGPLPWQPSLLDVGHDDYFEHHHPGCLDLAQSAFLTPAAPGAQPPPGWPIPEVQPLDCSREGSFRSLEANTATTLQLINAGSQTRRVYWLDYSGQRQPFLTLKPWDGATLQTYVTHPWVVTDLNGRCLGLYLPGAKPARAIVRP